MTGFESHITLEPTDKEMATPVAEGLGWHTSEITRDAVMGDKNWFYCTKNSQDYYQLKNDMGTLVRALQAAGVTVWRQKIEHIVVDIRHQN